MQKEKIYFYDDEYFSLEEICEKYEKLADEQKKRFRDCLAHYTLVQILKICNYDEKYIDAVLELAQTESDIIKLYGSDCGRVLMAIKSIYEKNLRKLINLTGKLVEKNDSRLDRFTNGEFLLNTLVCLTLGSSYKKDIVGDLFLIDCDSLSEDECQAIVNNFVRYMSDEEIISYGSPRKM